MSTAVRNAWMAPVSVAPIAQYATVKHTGLHGTILPTTPLCVQITRNRIGVLLPGRDRVEYFAMDELMIETEKGEDDA